MSTQGADTMDKASVLASFMTRARSQDMTLAELIRLAESLNGLGLGGEVGLALMVHGDGVARLPLHLDLRLEGLGDGGRDALDVALHGGARARARLAHDQRQLLQAARGLAMLFVSHYLGVVAGFAVQIMIGYALALAIETPSMLNDTA